MIVCIDKNGREWRVDTVTEAVQLAIALDKEQKQHVTQSLQREAESQFQKPYRDSH